MKPKKILNKISERKNKKKNNRERIIHQKRLSNLDYIISHNNSKNDAKSIYEENKSVLITNPNSRFNNYILNFNKKEGIVFHNYKKEANEYNNKGVEQNYKTNTHNKNSNKSQYFITEANSNKFDNLFKNKDNKLNSRIYENCLNKYKNCCSQEKIKLKTDINNNNNEYIVKKKSNNIPINKYVILHKKEKEKKIINKEFSNHKKNNNIYNNIYNSVNNSQTPLIKTSVNCSGISSIENNSIREKNNYVRNLGVSIFFNFWKEFVDKKAILLKMTKFSKFINLFNHYLVKILMKDFMQKLLLFKRKEQSLETYIKKLIFKMILNLIKQINEYKKYNMKEIKIFKKDLINNKYSDFHQEEGDFANDINIKSYTDCEGYKLHKKRKSKSPGLLSKLDEFKTTTFSCNVNSNLNININSNNNFNNDYNNNRRYTLANSYTDKILDTHKPTIYSDENYNYFNNNNDFNNDNEVEDNQNDDINQHEINNNDSTMFLSNKIFDNFIKNGESGVIVDQINQLKMVINLLERHNSKKLETIPPNSLTDCFKKWKSISLEKNKSLLNKIKTPRINEKIINLKPFQTSQKMNNINCINPINPMDISLKKNYSLNKISPKIINVINVQNFNENNNYNYNFKYMPIKDIPIYPNKSRHSYAYNNNININNINTDLNNIVNNNINENTINLNKCNNNIDITSFLMGNEKQRNTIVYHKKKLGSTPINNNYHFNCNPNLDSIINKSKISGVNFPLDQRGNYNNPSLLLFDRNISQLILQDFSNKLYNMNDYTIKTVTSPNEFRENSNNELRHSMYRERRPEEKYGFKKLNQIEEKEINFDNIGQKNKKLFMKKQYNEQTKEKINTGYQNNIKTNLFEKDKKSEKNENNENTNNKNNSNLIKCLNIQFANTSQELYKSERENRNNIILEKNNYITISEDTLNKNAINDKKTILSTNEKKRKTYDVDDDNDNDEIIINNEFNEYIETIPRSSKKINRIYKRKFRFDFGLDSSEEIKNGKHNHSFELKPKKYEKFKMLNIYNNNINITL